MRPQIVIDPEIDGVDPQQVEALLPGLREFDSTAEGIASARASERARQAGRKGQMPANLGLPAHHRGD